MTTFKVGDKVKLEGILEKNTGGDSKDYPLRLHLVGGIRLTFIEDGRYRRNSRKPTLIMVEPAPEPLKVGQMWIDFDGVKRYILDILDGMVFYRYQMPNETKWFGKSESIHRFNFFKGKLEEEVTCSK